MSQDKRRVCDRYILSLFPGIDLLGRSFETVGFQVLRGPDLLWGGDNRTFHPPANFFDGIIAGPPCQTKCQLISLGNITADDLIPDFLRTVEEANPRWAVLENVKGFLNHSAIPDSWLPIKLRDWDCGGFTFRTRYFWIYPSELILVPPKRPGKPEWSVLASSWKQHNSKRRVLNMHSRLSLKRACELQGFPELEKQLRPLGAQYAITLLGNGVPKAMGLFIAQAVKERFYQPKEQK